MAIVVNRKLEHLDWQVKGGCRSISVLTTQEQITTTFVNSHLGHLEEFGSSKGEAQAFLHEAAKGNQTHWGVDANKSIGTPTSRELREGMH